MPRITILLECILAICLISVVPALAQVDPADPVDPVGSIVPDSGGPIEPVAAEPVASEPALITKRGAITRSVFLPGLGQIYRGQKHKGLGVMATSLGTFILARMNEGGRQDAADEALYYEQLYRSLIVQTEIDAAFASGQAALQEASDKADARDRWFKLMGLVWIANIVDASLGWPAADHGVDVGLSRAPDGQPGFSVILTR